MTEGLLWAEAGCVSDGNGGGRAVSLTCAGVGMVTFVAVGALDCAVASTALAVGVPPPRFDGAIGLV